MSAQKRIKKDASRKDDIIEEEMPSLETESEPEMEAPVSQDEILEKLRKIQEHMGFLEKKLDLLLQQSQQQPHRSQERPPFRQKPQDFQRNRGGFNPYERKQERQPFRGPRDHGGRHGGPPRDSRGGSDNRHGGDRSGFRPRFGGPGKSHQGGHGHQGPHGNR